MNRQMARALNQWRDSAAGLCGGRGSSGCRSYIMQLPRAFRRWRREVGEAKRRAAATKHLAEKHKLQLTELKLRAEHKEKQAALEAALAEGGHGSQGAAGGAGAGRAGGAAARVARGGGEAEGRAAAQLRRRASASSGGVCARLRGVARDGGAAAQMMSGCGRARKDFKMPRCFRIWRENAGRTSSTRSEERLMSRNMRAKARG